MLLQSRMSEIIVTSLSSSSLTELLSAAVRGDFRRYTKNKTGFNGQGRSHVDHIVKRKKM